MSERISRRAILKTSIALAATSLVSPLGIASAVNKRRYVLVGAGAFGGWTALHLPRTGVMVRLIDGRPCGW